MYTARSVPIRKPAIILQAHAEHLGYETSFVCSATSTQGASRQPAHALHPLQNVPIAGAALLDLFSCFMCKMADCIFPATPSGQLTAGKQSPVSR